MNWGKASALSLSHRYGLFFCFSLSISHTKQRPLWHEITPPHSGHLHLFLSDQEGLDAFVPDLVQVLYLAHPELLPVTLVDCGQARTREERAFVAVLDLGLGQGGIERMVFYPAMIWLMAFGVHKMSEESAASGRCAACD
ncbi:MAG: hypothetical protein JW880_01785 [Candidatus Thermoplasmatota archaeon]|nr:hypothetical protein [Candidatus Thermoplasmatota archaeon]